MTFLFNLSPSDLISIRRRRPSMQLAAGRAPTLHTIIIIILCCKVIFITCFYFSNRFNNSTIYPPQKIITTTSSAANFTTDNITTSTDDTPEKKIRDNDGYSKNCDIFTGGWVPTSESPYYTNETCYSIQEHQNCMKYGRPDSGYLKWRWKPDGCELPKFDPLLFLRLFRHKSLAFVGDSIARNHFQSFICLLTRVAYPVEISNSSDDNKKHMVYKDYNFTVRMFWSPYLVKTGATFSEVNKNPFDLYLDEFDESWTSEISTFNYVIINAGHWFFRPTKFYLDGNLVGCLYCSEPQATQLTASFSYPLALRTAFRAIYGLENFKGVTFLRSFSPQHFENGAFDQGGSCERTVPFNRNDTILGKFKLDILDIQKQEFAAADKEWRRKELKFRFLDVTNAMLLRPDGHPNKYGHSPNPKVTMYNDCVHWCLPGPIDIWSDFFLELVKRDM